MLICVTTQNIAFSHANLVFVGLLRNNETGLTREFVATKSEFVYCSELLDMAIPQPSNIIDISLDKEARDTRLEDDVTALSARVRPRTDIQNYFVRTSCP